jgi:hypothetical protein
MAKKTVVTLTDDIDGSEGAETVEFGIDGFLYSIDLSAAHAEELRDRLTAYREFGTALGKLQSRSGSANLPSRPRRPANPGRNRHIRRWAEANGLPIKARGALPTSVIEKYEATHAIAA